MINEYNSRIIKNKFIPILFFYFEQVLQQLFRREQTTKIKEFDTFEKAGIEKDTKFLKYIGHFDLPGYNEYCKV